MLTTVRHSRPLEMISIVVLEVCWNTEVPGFRWIPRERSGHSHACYSILGAAGASQTITKKRQRTTQNLTKIRCVPVHSRLYKSFLQVNNLMRVPFYDLALPDCRFTRSACRCACEAQQIIAETLCYLLNHLETPKPTALPC